MNGRSGLPGAKTAFVTVRPSEIGDGVTVPPHEVTEPPSREGVLKLRKSPVGPTMVGAGLVPALIAPWVGRRLGGAAQNAPGW
ncbi:MAG: hypothetical protein ACUVQH_07465 [Thermogutta sp.]